MNDIELKANEAAKMLKSIAHRDRLLILCILSEGEKSVAELQQHSTLSQSAFSQHLAVLRKEALVETRKVSQSVYYRISNPNIAKILEALYQIYCQPKGE